jgi:membrane protein DedA with SNARE-associated domain
VTLTSGTLRFPYRRFVIFDAIASCTWALYAALLGYFGGRTFEHAAWKGLLVALVTGFALAGSIELGRRLLSRRRLASGDDST